MSADLFSSHPTRPAPSARGPQMPPWWPECPHCHRPIERIEWTAKPETPDVLIRWTCHGQQDWRIVSAEQAATADTIAMGFQRRAA